jgi:DNA-binding beta-propeller fold protein YncE
MPAARSRFALLALSHVVACADDGAAVDDETTTETTQGATSTAEPSTTTSAPSTTGTADTTTGEPQPDCVAEPPPEAMLRMGTNEDGTLLVPGGRRITPAGDNWALPGFPADIVPHPTLDVAYVTSTARYVRSLSTIDFSTGEVVQEIDREGAFFGLEVAPDGSRVYAAGGGANRLDSYDVAADGTLTEAGSLSLQRHPSGTAISDDGATLWVGQWRGTGVGDNKTSVVYEIDTATMTELRQLTVPLWTWDVAWVPMRDELYVSTLDDIGLAVVDLASGTTVAEIEVPISSAGLAVADDGSRVWAAIAGSDEVVAIDTATREIAARSFVGELEDGAGAVLHDSNVNAVAYDPASELVYATRGSDNAVSVLDASTLDLRGAIPSGWYPTDVAFAPDGARLLVAEGKGGWIGPSEGESITDRMAGTMTVVDTTAVDLDATSQQVLENYSRPGAAYPFECDVPQFPIPRRPEDVSPIEHVILVVKENKTFDCVFGDLEGVDVEIDPSLVEWGELYTPNLHALAREFGLSDNFYSEAAVSDQGHLWLTGGHVTEYAERTWIESYLDGQDFTGYQLQAPADPGAYFVHLLDNGIDFTVHGEIVGSLSQSTMGNGSVVEHLDVAFPGGTLVNYDVKDEEKALHVAGRIADGRLDAFSYLLLPNDHTVGTTPGKPTPESMVADNDYALGIVVDALSHSPLWESSVIFVVQDDPQGCTDHVDAHRTFVLVISPWARRGHISHVNTSFASVFATIDRILGIPPVGREVATAAPLWDFFTAIPDNTPYSALPRNIPETVNFVGAPGAEESAKMDFRGPDRNPELETLLRTYRAWQRGEITREQADARIAAPLGRD